MDSRVTTILVDEPHIPQFQKADPTGALESEFEVVVLRMITRLYPNCHAFKFRPRVDCNGVMWQPDLALVDKTHGFWFVVEVETINHHLEKHVVPQVTGFRDGDYGDDAAAIIAEQLSMSKESAATFLRYIPRYVAVISNHSDSRWEQRLASENVQYVAIERYDRGTGAPAYLVSGVLQAGERSIGIGSALSSHQVIRIRAGSYWKEQVYRITDVVGTTDWDCFILKGYAWLSKKRGLISVPDRAYVQFLENGDGSLIMRAI